MNIRNTNQLSWAIKYRSRTSCAASPGSQLHQVSSHKCPGVDNICPFPSRPPKSGKVFATNQFFGWFLVGEMEGFMQALAPPVNCSSLSLAWDNLHLFHRSTSLLPTNWPRNVEIIFLELLHKAPSSTWDIFYQIEATFNADFVWIGWKIFHHFHSVPSVCCIIQEHFQYHRPTYQTF